MKIFFIGTVDFSKKALQKLIDMKVNIVGVATKKSSSFHSDFADLSALCIKESIPYKFVDDINSKVSIDWISSLRPDYIFCFGWSALIKPELLKIPSRGSIGYHPALLPKNRGRHPLIWALVLGLSESACTFFFLDEGADSGDILLQKKFEIKYEDDAKSLKEKTHKIALGMIEELVFKLEHNTYQSIPQNMNQANIWRKRNEKDGEIDFRMSSSAIYKLIRALTKPYVGAHVIYSKRKIKIWQAKEVDINLPNIEYGKVLDIQNSEILVKCYDNAILFTNHEFDKLPKIGGYIH